MQFVMRDARLELEQEVLILGVVLGDLDIAAGEGLDRRPTLPLGDDQKTRDALIVTAQDTHALVARNGLVVRHSALDQEREIGIAFVGGSTSVPDASDHIGLDSATGGSDSENAGGEVVTK